MEFDIKEMVFLTIGGLGLFLFGMGMLTDGLKAAAGQNLKRLLERITKWPAMAMCVGAGVTALIQSSSATTVMVVGLVHAGMLTLKQALSVVLGANIGTTMTAWLVAGMSVFKISTYAMPAIGLGFILNVFGRRSRTRHWGQILLGFGILFIGIGFMKEAFSPLKESVGVQQFLISMGNHPILAVLAGTAITMLVQSSSASIAMIQTLAIAGAFGTDWEVVLRVTIPFVLGDNIGTTITAQLAALRTNLAGRRTAMGHTLFNVLGVAVVLPLVYLGWFHTIVMHMAPWELTATTIGFEIALAHSAFNITAALVILPFVGALERLVLRILPSKRGEADDLQPVTLEEHLLDTPPLAMQQAQREIVRMAKASRKAVKGSMAVMLRDELPRAKKVREKEDAVDGFQTEITRYLVRLSQRDLDPDMANELPVLLHSVNDLERIADHAVNILEAALRKAEHRHDLGETGAADIERMYTEVRRMFKAVLNALKTYDLDQARRALSHEELLNDMQSELRAAHVQRLADGTCTAMAGLIFVDLVDNIERIGDHLANIAQGILGGLQWGREGEDRPDSAPEGRQPSGRDDSNGPDGDESGPEPSEGPGGPAGTPA